MIAMSSWRSWEDNIKTFLQAIQRIGGEVDGYLFKAPSNIQLIHEVEDKLGIKLPLSFTKIVTEFSSGMEMNWSLPDDEELEVPLPANLKGIFAGNFSWSLKDIINVEQDRKSWEVEVFSNTEDDYDRVWHNKLGLIEVGNGDYIAFDLSIQVDPPIVYLSHDGGEGHGYILGNNFIDFMDRWTRIGCVGCEDWQLIPFMNDSSTGILADGENAIQWRKFLKVELP
jgi:hypothetical protein